MTWARLPSHQSRGTDGLPVPGARLPGGPIPACLVLLSYEPETWTPRPTLLPSILLTCYPGPGAFHALAP